MGAIHPQAGAPVSSGRCVRTSPGCPTRITVRTIWFRFPLLAITAAWEVPCLSASRPDVVLLRLCLITFRDLFLRVEPGPRRGTPHVSFRMVGPTIPAPGKRELAWLSSRAVSVSPAESQVARKHGPPSSRQARRATRQAQANSSVELVLGSWFGGAPLLPLPLTFPGRG